MIRKLLLNDRFILILILLNSAILFAGGYFPAEGEGLTLSILDNFITVLFILELIFRFQKDGFRGYFSSNWNKLDFILIVLSVPTLITSAFNLDFIDFSFLLVFRIMRVFKTFRFFKFIPNVEQLVAGVQRALKASVFIFIGFVIYIFIIGILSFYLFQGSGSEYFSDPMISLYSTFKIFTVDGWYEIPEQITAGYSSLEIFFTRLYFIFVVLTGGIFGLSLVNSIFVDAMMSDNNDELENKIDHLDSKITRLLTKIEENEARKNS